MFIVSARSGWKPWCNGPVCCLLVSECSSVGVVPVGGGGETGGLLINHPSDLRRRRVKRGGERRGAGLFLRGGSVVHAGYKAVPSLPPNPRQGAMNSRILLHLLERWQTNELLLLPPFLSPPPLPSPTSLWSSILRKNVFLWEEMQWHESPNGKWIKCFSPSSCFFSAICKQGCNLLHGVCFVPGDCK